MPALKYEVADFKAREGLFRFVIRKFPARGLAPLWGAMAFVGVALTATVYHSFQKSEVQLNRATKYAPWEWTRAKHEFGKKHKLLFDSADHYQPIPELAVLDEMEQEEMKRFGK